MILYHGSSILIDKPDILHSERRLDFGDDLNTDFGLHVTNCS